MENKIFNIRVDSKEIHCLLFYVFGQFFMLFTIVITFSIDSLKIMVILSIICALLWICSLLGLVYAIVSIIKKAKQLEKYEEMLMETDYRLRIVKSIEEQNSQVRKFYHDISSHLSVIEELKKSGKIEEAKKYSEQIKKEYQDKVME
ncbi:MAG: hypothetical protein RR568_00075 [Anaerorhabdus sp.]|uniref:hypothetical protein n=1 Tax=Anaerorhabdus sp. TaxID=1872524 RepID=UPI002FCC471A